MRVDWHKLAGILVVNVSATVVAVTALVTHTVDAEVVFALVSGQWGTTLGYLFGNGRLVKAGETPQPVLSPRAEG